jgi:hypothetical protein
MMLCMALLLGGVEEMEGGEVCVSVYIIEACCGGG